MREYNKRKGGDARMRIEKVQTAGRRLSLLMKGLMVVLVTSAVVQALLIGCLLRTFTEYGLFSAAERVVRLLLWAMICRRAAELFQTAGQGEPFVSKNVGRLRRIALCFVGMGFLPGLAGKLAVLGAPDKAAPVDRLVSLGGAYIRAV